MKGREFANELRALAEMSGVDLAARVPDATPAPDTQASAESPDTEIERLTTELAEARLTIEKFEAAEKLRADQQGDSPIRIPAQVAAANARANREIGSMRAQMAEAAETHRREMLTLQERHERELAAAEARRVRETGILEERIERMGNAKPAAEDPRLKDQALEIARLNGLLTKSEEALAEAFTPEAVREIMQTFGTAIYKTLKEIDQEEPGFISRVMSSGRISQERKDLITEAFRANGEDLILEL